MFDIAVVSCIRFAVIVRGIKLGYNPVIEHCHLALELPLALHWPTAVVLLCWQRRVLAMGGNARVLAISG